MPRDAMDGLKTFTRDLKNAKRTIKATIYSFTHKKIAKAIKKAAKRGVKVEIIFDKESNLRKKYSKIGDLSKIKNIKVYYISGFRSKKGHYEGKMHMKMVIIDSKKIYLGSANWSNSAFSLNYELLFSTTNQKIIQKSLKFFNFVKKRAIYY